MTMPIWWCRSAIPATPWDRWAARSPTWRCWIPSSPAARWSRLNRCAASASASPPRSGAGSIASWKRSRSPHGQNSRTPAWCWSMSTCPDCSSRTARCHSRSRCTSRLPISPPISRRPASKASRSPTSPAKIASPDVQGAFGAITADVFGAAYPDVMSVQRPALQKIYEAYFRDNKLDAILFPTTIAPAPVIDMEKGSSEMSVNGGAPVPTFDTMIRNTDPGSNAGLPGLSLFAGMTRGRPAGRTRDRRSRRQRHQTARARAFDRSHFGNGAAAEGLIRHSGAARQG